MCILDLCFSGSHPLSCCQSRQRSPSRTTRTQRGRPVESGEILPLADILAAVRGKLPGEVVGVEIESKNGHWIYEFRVLDGKGHLYEVYVDARSGEIDQTKEK